MLRNIKLLGAAKGNTFLFGLKIRDRIKIT